MIIKYKSSSNARWRHWWAHKVQLSATRSWFGWLLCVVRGQRIHQLVGSQLLIVSTIATAICVRAVCDARAPHSTIPVQHTKATCCSCAEANRRTEKLPLRPQTISNQNQGQPNNRTSLVPFWFRVLSQCQLLVVSIQ